MVELWIGIYNSTVMCMVLTAFFCEIHNFIRVWSPSYHSLSSYLNIVGYLRICSSVSINLRIKNLPNLKVQCYTQWCVILLPRSITVILGLVVSFGKESIDVDMFTVYVMTPFGSAGGRHVMMRVLDELTGELILTSLT